LPQHSRYYLTVIAGLIDNIDGDLRVAWTSMQANSAICGFRAFFGYCWETFNNGNCGYGGGRENLT
jgi:hypothetical protein